MCTIKIKIISSKNKIFLKIINKSIKIFLIFITIVNQILPELLPKTIYIGILLNWHYIFVQTKDNRSKDILPI